MASPKQKPYRGIGMEGFIATSYAKNTKRDLADFRREAKMIAERLVPGSSVLEIAPGPGYLSIELARLGRFRIVGLDISQTFVRLATENAAKAAVDVQFRQGDAQAIPFGADTFDFIICRAAFKNFSDPVAALDEIRRTMKPSGAALIIDMRNDVSNKAIDDFVAARRAGPMNALMMKWTFKHMLRMRAYSRQQIIDMVDTVGFAACDISDDAIGMKIWLRKQQ
jgi:ubiquinone/menaquinone biosynthesis C-methylase UbiE